jgi:hypothetical protein
VSYWVGISLVQGEIPRVTSLIHVNFMRWMGSRLNGHKAHDILGVIVSHSWFPLYRVCCTFICKCTFSNPIIGLLSLFLYIFFHNSIRRDLSSLPWCGDQVVEMSPTNN